MDATHRGETDGTLLVYGLDKKYIKETHGMRREFVDDIIHQFRFAVHKGDTATLFRLNEALATVRHNGTFDRLYDEWIGPIEPHPIRLADLRPYAQPIALGVLAIAAIICLKRTRPMPHPDKPSASAIPGVPVPKPYPYADAPAFPTTIGAGPAGLPLHACMGLNSCQGSDRFGTSGPPGGARQQCSVVG
eukprot:gene43422-58822_t